MITAFILLLLMAGGIAWLVLMAGLELVWLVFKLIFGLGAALFGVSKFLFILAAVAFIVLFKGLLVLALGAVVVGSLAAWLFGRSRRRAAVDGAARRFTRYTRHERDTVWRDRDDSLHALREALDRMERRSAKLESMLRRQRGVNPGW